MKNIMKELEDDLKYGMEFKCISDKSSINKKIYTKEEGKELLVVSIEYFSSDK